jgi:hypothetical protein
MRQPDQGPVFSFLDSVTCVSNSLEDERWKGLGRRLAQGAQACIARQNRYARRFAGRLVSDSVREFPLCTQQKRWTA